MPRLNKEEERAEKIIRGLLKLPENKRCINCNSLGPQYVCTNFWTFTCTICSGIHREFTHRVKSVSMATFSMEEVNALKIGGNERAREIYFKALDGHRNFIPDSSNHHKLRDFIKHVYVDRKYIGESNHLAMIRRDDIDGSKDKHSGTERSNQVAEEPPHLGHSASAPSIRNSRDEVVRQDSNEKPRSARDAFLELFSNGPFSERPREGTREPYSSERPHRGAREDILGRPPFERSRGNIRSDFLGRHSFDTPSRGGRDDVLERHSFENSGPGSRDEFPERNSSKIGLRNTMSSRNFNEEDSKSGGQRTRKPRFEIVDDRFREDNNSGTARHYESIRYSNSRHNVGNASPDSPRRRDTRKPLAICSATEALDKKIPPLKPGESIRPIDVKSSRDSPTVQDNSDPKDSTTVKENESNKATTTNLLDSDPTPETTSTIDNDEGEKTDPVDEGENKTSSIDNGEGPSPPNKEASDAQNVTPLECLLLDWTTPSNTTPEDSTSSMSNVAGSIPSDMTSNNQCQTDLSIQTIEALPDSRTDSIPEVEQGPPSVIAESNQNWSSAPATNDKGAFANGNESQDYSQALVIRGSDESQNSKQALESSSSNESQQSKRKELPMDLFSGSYAPFPVRGPVPVAVPGWQLHPSPHVMGYGMQYPPVPTCTVGDGTQTAASRNPFDIGGDGTQTAAQTFPHMPLVQGAQPNMIAPTGYQNQETSHAFSWQSHQYRPYGMSTVPGAFQGQEVPYDTMDSSNADAFASLNSSQQLSTRHPAPTTSNSATTGGNPFG